MSYVLEPRSESELFELEDSEDQDYVPGVADRLEEDVELHVEREENTEASDDNEGARERVEVGGREGAEIDN